MIRRDGRALLDLLPVQIDLDAAVVFVQLLDGVGRDEHQPVWQPIAGVGDDVTDGPMLVVEVEVFDFANFTVARRQVATAQLMTAV